MKIAVSSKGNKLTSQVDERFGRCAFFMIIEPESLEYEVIENTGSEQGAGVTAAKTIVNAGAQALITGSCGPKAFMVLKEANTDVILNGAGRVIDVIQQYKNGMFHKASAPNAEGGMGTKKEECRENI